MRRQIGNLLVLLLLLGCQPNEPDHYDVIVRNGQVFDGSGAPGQYTDIAITGDKIVRVGNLGAATSKIEIDATGQVVSPGFVNMLSWAPHSLVTDGRGLSDIKQGVTLEVFGEGRSMGPNNEATRKLAQDRINKAPFPFQIEWTTLGEYLQFIENKGVSPNVASFVGATTVRVNALGFEDRAPNEKELQAMRDEVRVAMEEGAMGLGSSLIYAPAFYAKTDELIALAKVVGEYNGMYISHMRSEGNRLLESVDELITIARDSGVAAEIYHLKASGKSNWSKMDEVYAKIETARMNGLKITANMYTYPAGSTGLDASMPPWVQEGGYDAWVNRLRDPLIRARVLEEMRRDTDDWENLFHAAGPDGILLAYFQNPELKKYSGKTLTEVATLRETTPAETAIDLVIEDGTRVQTIYFLMSEDNIRKQLGYPWLSFGSDASAVDPDIVRELGTTHPRTYGNFVRVIGKYVRDEKVLSMEDAIRKLTSLPMANLKVSLRGLIKPGYYADVVIFDPASVVDHATFADAHRLATGVNHVFINGTQVLRDGEHTGATPGRFIKGPGYKVP